MRSCDGFGVARVYATGYTPFPEQIHDDRLPHVIRSVSTRINKTALGAQKTVPCIFHRSPMQLILQLQGNGFVVHALEQHKRAQNITLYQPPLAPIALCVGSEIGGLPDNMVTAANVVLEIPMHGIKVSFNVSVATGIALYELTRHLK